MLSTGTTASFPSPLRKTAWLLMMEPSRFKFIQSGSGCAPLGKSVANRTGACAGLQSLPYRFCYDPRSCRAGTGIQSFAKTGLLPLVASSSPRATPSDRQNSLGRSRLFMAVNWIIRIQLAS